MSALIISAFPACGKSYYYNKYSVYSNHATRDHDSGLKILDSDSSEFSWIIDEEGNKVRNPEFPQNYIDHINEKKETEDIIFVSSHDEVRRALNDAGIRFFLIYPSLWLKDFWLETVKNRKTGINSESFVNMLNENWKKFIRGIEESFMENCIKIEITSADIFIETIVARNIDFLKQIADNPSIYSGYDTKFEFERDDNRLVNFNLIDVRNASLNDKTVKHSPATVVKKSMDEKVIDIVNEYINNHLDKSDKKVDFEVYTVWKCKTLQNWKYLLSSTLPDGMYYELTYDGDKEEWYLDAYKKFDNVTIPDKQ